MFAGQIALVDVLDILFFIVFIGLVIAFYKYRHFLSAKAKARSPGISLLNRLRRLRTAHKRQARDFHYDVDLERQRTEDAIREYDRSELAGVSSTSMNGEKLASILEYLHKLPQDPSDFASLRSKRLTEDDGDDDSSSISTSSTSTPTPGPRRGASGRHTSISMNSNRVSVVVLEPSRARSHADSDRERKAQIRESFPYSLGSFASNSTSNSLVTGGGGDQKRKHFFEDLISSFPTPPPQSANNAHSESKSISATSRAKTKASIKSKVNISTSPVPPLLGLSVVNVGSFSSLSTITLPTTPGQGPQGDHTNLKIFDWELPAEPPKALFTLE